MEMAGANSKGDEKNQQLYRNLQKVELNAKRSARNGPQRSIRLVGGNNGYAGVRYRTRELEVVKAIKEEE